MKSKHMVFLMSLCCYNPMIHNHAHQKLFPNIVAHPACSCYPFLYTIHKRPLSSYATSMSLNCTTLDYHLATSTSLNCTSLNPSWPLSSTMLNCRTTQTTDDMPSSHHRHLGHLRHLSILGYWTYDDMPSSHLGYLRHLGHLGHLSYLGTIGNLDTLDPYPLATVLTDSSPKAFITELDPEDPGPPQGYFTDNLLNPLPTATPLLLHYTSQFPHISQTALNGHSPDIPLDALDGHGSLLGEDT